MRLNKSLLENNRTYEVLFIFAVLASFVVWFSNIIINKDASTSFNIFLLRCKDIWGDSINVIGYSAQRDVYHDMHYMGLQEKSYPPLTYMLSWLYSRMVDMTPYFDANDFRPMYTDKRVIVMLSLLYSMVAVIFYESIRASKNGPYAIKVLTAFTCLLGAPVISAYERGNTIIFVTALIMVYVFNYDSENKILRELALISLAAAAAFKITPACLGILLIYNKQWKEIVRIVIYGIVLFFGPFLFFWGGFSNIPQFISNISSNLETYTIINGVTFTGCVVHVFNIQPDGYDLAISILKPITYVIAGIFIIATPLFTRRWERVLTISLILVTLPSHSGNYCALYLIPAIIAFLNEEKHKIHELLVLVGLTSILFIVYVYESFKVGPKFGILICTIYMLVKSIIVLCKFTSNKLSSRKLQTKSN